jgi:hypothetical protein
MDFVGRYAVLAVHKLPHGCEPLVQTKRRVFIDGPGLRSELAVIVACAALPAVIFLKKGNILGATARTFNAIGPATRYNVLAAICRAGEI